LPDLNINTLPFYQNRRFVPENADFSQTQVAVELFEQLANRPLEIPDALQQWLLDRSELEAAFDQHRAILYIQMTCQTDNPDYANAYQAFIENVVPAVKPITDQLNRRMIEAVDTLGFNDPHYDVYFQAVRSDIELFREKNTPLQTQDDLLSQRYQTITGAMTVQFRGDELPIAKMRKFLYEPDRPIRQEAWKAEAQRRLEDTDALDEIFDKMISARHQIAQNAGHENYCDYKFKEYHRFSYTPEDCKRFHTAAETHLVPLLRQFHRYRMEQMRLKQLRPWDTVADPLGAEPLVPADNLRDFIQGLIKMFDRVDPEFGRQFKMMDKTGLLDLDSRKGKAPGGYQSTLNEARKPFIFGNTIGNNSDLRLMTHEGGHAFHAMACAADPLLAYRQAPLEFCEVASMSMELLAAAHLDVFYNESEQKRWWQEQLEMTIFLLLRVAAIDAFQHWLYENPSHTRTQRDKKWIELDERFSSGLIDWTGLQAERASYWHRVLHFFQVPFYYIEYGIAQLGALGIWLQSKDEMTLAVNNYKKALSLGGCRPLPELFEAAGLPFDFSEKTIQPLAEAIHREWESFSETQKKETT
jgi:oligoendopeptidase F